MSVDLGIVVIRVLFGMAMSVHGAQKLFGWFGGYGINGTGAFFEELGFRPGIRFAAVVGLIELGGGILLTFGLFTPFGAAAVLTSMLLAIVSVQFRNPLFTIAAEMEMPFFYAASAVGLAFTGGGAFSLDAVFGYRFVGELFLIEGVLVLAVAAAAVALGLRRKSMIESHHQAR